MNYSLLALAAFSLSLPLQAHAKCSASTVALAQSVLTQATRSYDAGTVTLSYELEARVAFENASLCAGNITQQDYCTAVGPLLAQIQKVALSGASIGTQDHLADVVNEQIRYDQTCN